MPPPVPATALCAGDAAGEVHLDLGIGIEDQNAAAVYPTWAVLLAMELFFQVEDHRVDSHDGDAAAAGGKGAADLIARNLDAVQGQRGIHVQNAAPGTQRVYRR